MRYSPPLFGLAWGAVLAAQRRAALATLRLVLGPRRRVDELRDLAAIFAKYAGCMTDALLLGSGRGYRIRSRVVGGHHWQACQPMGHGLVMAAAHTAGWDIGGPALASLQDRPVMVVMEQEHDAQARALHDAARHRAGVQVLHAGTDPLAALPLLHHLRRRQGVVAMKFDRLAPGMRARHAVLFGQPWRVPEGILRLGAVTQAPILPVFTRRLGFLDYQIIASPPILLPRRPDEAELDAAAQRLASLLERFARAYPTDWFRFAPDPDDVPPPVH
ncbi:MAG: lysophospholipid acyltransferase family protein [Deltaproteobacteria bacterium]|nr:lysophospholipid acyltransferase family protein [Deltaproteobacteria bacterium]